MISSANNDQNHAQKEGSDDTDDTNDNLCKLLGNSEIAKSSTLLITEDPAKVRNSIADQAVNGPNFDKNKLDIKNHTKAPGSQYKDQYIIDPGPATGIFLLENNFLTGHLRMRAEGEGAYPTDYLAIIECLFGPEPNTIEVCSRTIREGCFTVDINPEFKPDLVVDGQTLEGIKDNTFSRWRCDPPYTGNTAKNMYGTEPPKLGKLLVAGARVVKPGSLMFLLCSQQYQNCPASVKRIGFVYISVVPNNETRILNIYVKLPEV